MTEPKLPEGAVEVARITIVKTFDDNADGGMGCWVGYSDDLSLIDALGMVAFAQATTLGNYMDDDEETP